MNALPASAVAHDHPEPTIGPGRFLMLLGLLVALTYPDVVLGLRTFAYRDYGIFGYPLAHHLRSSIWAGHFPLWNPLSNCGLPFLAQWNTLTLYPGSLLYILFPMPASLAFFCLLHLLAAGLGMFLLARRWTGSSLAAAVAGIAFGFNGLSLHFLMWPNNIAALAWMPFVILTVAAATRTGGRKIVWAGLVGGVQLLTGAPEIILLTWILAGILVLPTLTMAFRSGVRETVRLVGAAGLAALVAAAQLLPFLDLLRHSHRDASFASNMDWAMPGTGWANFVVPLFRSFDGRQGVRWQLNQAWTSSYYVGIAVLMLALATLVCVRRRQVAGLGIALLVSLLFALGAAGHVYPLALKVLPALGMIRFPIKFVVLAVFCLPLLAAFFVAELQASRGVNRERQLARVLWGIGGTLVVVVAVLVVYERLFPGIHVKWQETAVNGAVRALVLVAFLVLLQLLIRARETRKAMVFGALLLVVLGVDVMTHMARQNPTVPPGLALQPNAPDIARAREITPAPEFGVGRAALTVKALEELRFRYTPDLANDFLIFRLSLFNNTNLLDGLAKTDGFYSLYLGHSYEVTHSLLHPPYGRPEALLDFLNVSHISAARAAYEWDKRDTAMPLVTVGQAPAYETDWAACDRLFQKAFRPREVVYLPPEAASAIGERPRTEGKVSDLTVSPQRISATLEAEAPTMAVISQSYYHPWKARIDGEAVPLWRANRGFQAVAVPAGIHQLELRYVDRFFQLGGAISLLTIGVCGGGLWFTRQRPGEGDPGDPA